MNFFTWIRDGVRQAVLPGVSDAVGDIGQPPESDDVRQYLLEAMRSGGPDKSAGTATLPIQARRKKLGRSLNDIQPT